jgi:hypothetical protein
MTGYAEPAQAVAMIRMMYFATLLWIVINRM